MKNRDEMTSAMMSSSNISVVTESPDLLGLSITENVGIEILWDVEELVHNETGTCKYKDDKHMGHCCNRNTNFGDIPSSKKCPGTYDFRASHHRIHKYRNVSFQGH